jgi:alanyl-tRNA synthetase
MQRFKPLFSDPEHTGTLANVQTCLRLNDLDEIGDATHYLTFHMIGLFSFRTLSLQDAIDFWLSFLERIGLPPDHVTIHPDKLEEWTPLYQGRVPIVPDPECRWSDGSIQGYCTEFYRDGVEIGNIVNPLGTCIDCGFGLERIAGLIEGSTAPGKTAILLDAVETITASGYRPGPRQQGYVLRKLLRLLGGLAPELDHPLVQAEIGRQRRSLERYERLKPRFPVASPSWWWDTHGIVIDEVETGSVP